MMKVNAAVYTAPHTIEYIKDYQFEQPFREDDVLVKVLCAGICGSDMHAYHGHDSRRQPDLILGHELAGEVVAGELSGKLVTANPLITCGKCPNCLSGRDNLCTNRDMIGMNRQGAFAEFVSIPRQCLIEAPKHMLPEHIALTEPAATLVHAIKLLKKATYKPLTDAKILIIGGGAIGFLAALYLRNQTQDITLLETNTLRLKHIEKYIGVKAYNPMQHTTVTDYFDIVIDCVGSNITRQQSFKSIASGGCIMHIGLQDHASEVDMRKLTLSEISLLGSYTYTMQDFAQTLQLLADGYFGDLSWIMSAPLNEAATLFQNLDNGDIAAAKVMLHPYTNHQK